jgi:hypothetical protein
VLTIEAPQANARARIVAALTRELGEERLDG